jgi:hypothetical protein
MAVSLSRSKPQIQSFRLFGGMLKFMAKQLEVVRASR